MIKLTARFYKEHDSRSRREWPRYATQLLNIAGQNAQCFKATKVGSMKETWLAFMETGLPDTIENWEQFYIEQQGWEGIEWAADKLFDKAVNDMCIPWLNKELCRSYVEEVIFNKTHFGMGGETSAIKAAAKYFDMEYRFSTAEEESQGIDGWLGDYPVQVKPQDSYKVGHVFNKADTSKQLVVTYEKKKHTCYIHNPEFIEQ